MCVDGQGEECSLNVLGAIADATGGHVSQVNPASVRRQHYLCYLSIIDESVNVVYVIVCSWGSVCR